MGCTVLYNSVRKLYMGMYNETLHVYICFIHSVRNEHTIDCMHTSDVVFVCQAIPTILVVLAAARSDHGARQEEAQPCKDVQLWHYHVSSCQIGITCLWGCFFAFDIWVYNNRSGYNAVLL